MLKKMKYRLDFIRHLLPYAEKKAKYITVIAIISLIGFVTDMLSPQIYRIFIDDVVLGGKFQKFYLVVFGYLFFYTIAVGMSYSKYYTSIRFSNQLTLTVKEKILHNFLQKKFTEYDTMNIGEVKMRIEDDTAQINKFVYDQSIGLIFSYITAVVCIILLFVMEWRLALFSIVTIPATIFIDHKLSFREKRLNAENRINDRNMVSWLHESLQGWREIKAHCLEKQQQRKFNGYLFNFAVYYGKFINYWTARTLVLPKIKDVLFMQLGLYFFGGFLIMNGDLKIGELLLFAVYYEKLSQSIQNLSNQDADLQASMPFTDRLIDELDKVPEICRVEHLSSRPFWQLCLDNVSFSYHANQDMLFRHVFFEIRAGERIAVIGNSGEGKTTLLKLLFGMLTPTSGTVSYNGIDLRDVNLDDLFRRVGFIMQNSTLVNRTIRDNLLYGKEDATEEELWAACEKAYIHTFLRTLPEGLDTIVGERGIKLSSGQRQRLVLARTFLKSPDIYVFDEATANLDPESEAFIHKALAEIDSSKTMIFVSHRKSSLALCDRIFEVKAKSLLPVNAE